MLCRPAVAVPIFAVIGFFLGLERADD